MTGNLFVVAGPSGVGKSTLEKMLFQAVEGLTYSVSATTRAPRPGEEDGKDYFFVDHDEFQRMIDEDELAEWAEFFGNRYGTPNSFVEEKLAEGFDIVIDVEVEGVEQLRRRFGRAVYILVAPPSMAALKNRLSGRGTEKVDELAQRLDRAAHELSKLKSLAHEYLGHTKLGYDYVIINDDLDSAFSELKSIVLATRASLPNRMDKLDKLLSEEL